MNHKKTPIYLDIETIPGQHPSVLQALKDEAAEERAAISAPGNWKDPEKIADYILQKQQEIDASVETRWRKTSFDGAFGQVATISLAVANDAPINLFYEQWAASEPALLRDLNHAVSQAYTPSCDMRPMFVGHNVLGFDLRFLYQRYIVNGVRPHSAIPFNARPWDGDVFDTMLQWAGHGGNVKLDKLCRVFNIPTKGAELGGEEIDGSMVWDFVKGGRIKDVAIYCGGDVDRVREVHRRMDFFYQQEAAA